MQIKNNIYNDIIYSLNDMPPETGGILGGVNNIITSSVQDFGIKKDNLCSYTPNVEVMNSVINEWRKKDIDFMGIYHTHFWGVDSLSQGDKTYIELIMKNMPNYLSILYFPLIVLPYKSMISYKAVLTNGRLAISKEETYIC